MKKDNPYLFNKRRYYNREEDGCSYYIDNDILMSCPTNADGTPDTYDGVQGSVAYFDEPATLDERKEINKALRDK